MKIRFSSLFLYLCISLALFTRAIATEGSGFANFQKGNTYQVGQFSDVSVDSWYSESVVTAYELGLVKGTSEDSFSPNGNIGIAETIALACRLHNTYHTNGAAFEQAEPWYQVYVDYAVEHDIINEVQFSNYTKTATRLEFASILANALPKEALEPINTVKTLPDVLVGSEFADAVFLLYRAGVLTGSDAYGTFSPNSAITRCEVATIVTRMADATARKTFSLQRKVSVTASTHSVITNSFEEPAIVYITCAIEDVTFKYTSTEPGVVIGIWGDWSENVLPLMILPSKIGKTTMLISNDKTSDIVPISVTVSDYFFTDQAFLALAKDAHSYLLSVLKNPASLQIHSIHSAYLAGKPVIIMDYSGMNSYGGYDRKDYAFWLDPSFAIGGAVVTAGDWEYIEQMKEIPVEAIK